ncbi:MAG: hypothetical protein ACJ8LG_10250 [Massilia sp.]
MSSIVIDDLAYTARLDSRAMARVRGGVSQWRPDVNVNVTLNQQITQDQKIGISVLNNNGVIGSGFKGPNISLSPSQWAKNEAILFNW